MNLRERQKSRRTKVECDKSKLALNELILGVYSIQAFQKDNTELKITKTAVIN